MKRITGMMIVAIAFMGSGCSMMGGKSHGHCADNCAHHKHDAAHKAECACEGCKNHKDAKAGDPACAKCGSEKAGG